VCTAMPVPLHELLWFKSYFVPQLFRWICIKWSYLRSKHCLQFNSYLWKMCNGLCPFQRSVLSLSNRQQLQTMWLSRLHCLCFMQNGILSIIRLNLLILSSLVSKLRNFSNLHELHWRIHIVWKLFYFSM